MLQTVAVLGEQALLEGFQLAGATLFSAETDDAVRVAYAALPGTVGLVILTPRAAAVLGASLSDPTGPLMVVLPS